MLKHRVIGYGEVLWDLLPEGSRIGGAPLNVCYHLNRAGIESHIISQIGKDQLGVDLLEEIEKLGVNTSYLSLTDNYPTSTVQVSLDDKGSPKYTIVENVAWDYMVYNPKVADEIASADAFVFGSLVARNKPSYDTLMKYIGSAQYAVLDVNLRVPFYTKEKVIGLLEQVDLLKINDEEIQIIAKWLSVENMDEMATCSYLLDFFPKLKEIILTKGSKGAMYFSRNVNESIGIYDVTVSDTIGAGDSFLAAFLSKKLKGATIHESLDEAALVSAYVASKSGANPIYSKEDLDYFRNNTILKKPLQ